MAKIPIAEFIETVREEILEYQAKHEGELALMRFKEAELEISVASTIDSGGKVSVFVVDLEGHQQQEHTHKVRLTFDFLVGFNEVDFTKEVITPGGDVAELTELDSSLVHNEPTDEMA